MRVTSVSALRLCTSNHTHRACPALPDAEAEVQRELKRAADKSGHPVPLQKPVLWRSARERTVWLRDVRRAVLANSASTAAFAAAALGDRSQRLLLRLAKVRAATVDEFAEERWLARRRKREWLAAAGATAIAFTPAPAAPVDRRDSEEGDSEEREVEQAAAAAAAAAAPEPEPEPEPPVKVGRASGRTIKRAKSKTEAAEVRGAWSCWRLGVLNVAGNCIHIHRKDVAFGVLSARPF